MSSEKLSTFPISKFVSQVGPGAPGYLSGFRHFVLAQWESVFPSQITSSGSKSRNPLWSELNGSSCERCALSAFCALACLGVGALSGHLIRTYGNLLRKSEKVVLTNLLQEFDCIVRHDRMVSVNRHPCEEAADLIHQASPGHLAQASNLICLEWRNRR